MAAPVSSPCSSPPSVPSSSSSSVGRGRRSRSSCCFLLHTNTTSRPAAAVNVRRGLPSPPYALPETAGASVLVAGLVAGGVLLLRGGNSKQQQQQAKEEAEEEATQIAEEACSACGGSGLCPRCKGEGFVFKEVAEETASRARKAAKNMATRYTAGLPTKWTYCNRCSSTRSCTKCQGTGTQQAATPTTL